MGITLTTLIRNRPWPFVLSQRPWTFQVPGAYDVAPIITPCISYKGVKAASRNSQLIRPKNKQQNNQLDSNKSYIRLG